MKKIVVIAFPLLSNIVSPAQELQVRTTLRYERHYLNINNGPPSTQGEHLDQTMFYGVGLSYAQKLSKQFNVSVGINNIQYHSRVKRAYDKKYWNDWTAILHYTDDTKYNLLSVPVAINYVIKSYKDLSILAGTSVNLNFTYMQKYGQKDYGFDKLKRFYFFGFSNQVSIAFRKYFSLKDFIELRPFLSIYERWRKDKVLYESQNEFYNFGLNTVGLNASFGINF